MKITLTLPLVLLFSTVATTIVAMEDSGDLTATTALTDDAAAALRKKADLVAQRAELDKEIAETTAKLSAGTLKLQERLTAKEQAVATLAAKQKALSTALATRQAEKDRVLAALVIQYRAAEAAATKEQDASIAKAETDVKKCATELEKATKDKDGLAAELEKALAAGKNPESKGFSLLGLFGL